MEGMGGENMTNENKNQGMGSNDMQSGDQSQYQSRMQEGGDPGMKDMDIGGGSLQGEGQGNYRAAAGMGSDQRQETGDISSGQTGGGSSMQEEGSMHSQEPAEGSSKAAEGQGTEQQQMGTTGPSGNMQMTGAEGSGMPEGGAGMSSHTASSSEEGGGRISSTQIQEYLGGINYPAMKQDMLDAARSNKAPEEVMSFMNRLPEKTYNSPTDIEEEFGKIR